MAKQSAIKQLIHLMCATGMMTLSTTASAAAFQLYEQDGASVGDYHAGRAAQANNASTAFYNPAGLTRIPNQQFVFGDVAVLSDLKYRGTVSVNTISAGAPTYVVNQGGAFSTIPDLFYVAPINDRIAFGFSIVAPFGLKTDYGRVTNLRYAATATELTVVDVSPSLAFKIIPQLSIGAGYDWQRFGAEFNQDAMISGFNSYAYNKAWSSASGGHIGALYSPWESTRFGLSFNSQVVHHPHGTSKLIGPGASFVTGIPAPFGPGNPQAIVSTQAYTRVTLPAYTTLSAFHQLNSRWALMGTAIYTRWSTFKTLTLSNIATVNLVGFLPVASSTGSLTLTENYRDAWNFSLGTEFYATEKATLRGGIGYDESPIKNNLRDVRIPDNTRYAFALGGHYQAIKQLGFDIGWTHLFVPGHTNITPPPLSVGAQTTVTRGYMQANADIFGAQITWDIV
jgi:long-chain fatty acid transport protein